MNELQKKEFDLKIAYKNKSAAEKLGQPSALRRINKSIEKLESEITNLKIK